MRAWGYDPLDKDAALNVQHLWDHYIEGSSGSRKYTEEGIVHYFIEQRWGEAVHYGDSITNGEIIALTEIFRANGLKITEKLRELAETAINRELQEQALELWEDPDKRKMGLLQLLDHIGGKLKKIPKEKDGKDPCAVYESRAVAECELMKMTAVEPGWEFSDQLFHNEELKRATPEFIKTLHRYVHHGIWEKDGEISAEVKSQRLMMIAYYLGMAIGYSDDKISELIRDAKGKG
jgi:hypothetical protein